MAIPMHHRPQLPPTIVFPPRGRAEAIWRRRSGGAGAARRGPDSGPRRTDRAAGTFRFRQVHAAQHPGRTGSSHVGVTPGSAIWTWPTASDEADHALSPSPRRLRVPVLQPHRESHGRGERGTGDRGGGRPDVGGRGAATGGPGTARRITFPGAACPAASSSAWPSRAPSPSGPQVLLCDEPTGALDVATGIRVLEDTGDGEPRRSAPPRC